MTENELIQAIQERVEQERRAVYEEDEVSLLPGAWEPELPAPFLFVSYFALRFVFCLMCRARY